MSATPLEPGSRVLMQPSLATAATSAASARANFRSYLWLISAFWVYVLISNLMYANNMQASITAMNVDQHVFAGSTARLLQHLLLYPLFILCMWRSLRTGWAPLWRTVPIQLLFALVFATLAAPALEMGEHIADAWSPVASATMAGGMHEDNTWSAFFTGPQVPTWIASITNFLVQYCFGLALVTGFAIYQRLRDAQLRSAALERALTHAHLAALRMQLSPHTLFNLLHTIRGQITWDPPAAQTMVVQLGDLLRRLLTAGEREFSRLADEIQFVTLYLELQQKRFADRLAVSVPARGSLPQVWVPSLILQPLVENAVVHGMAGHDGAVNITVEASMAGESLTLRVANTTAHGRSPGVAGIGVANVRERLHVQFGERATFTAGPEGPDTWVALIVMPLLRDGPGGAPP